MGDGSVNNQRIAKNTILLYIRMLITLVISLYTSRVILDVLGQNDFGIYNVIGGVVILFSFLTNAMTNSTQRFLNYYLGLDDSEKLKKLFDTAIYAHLTIVIAVLVLSETIGLWFVETQLNIPIERMGAARVVYQMTILATLFGIIVVPYRASIIAAERMNVFAIISILEVVLKLVVVFILPVSNYDRLVLYSILQAAIAFIVLFLYRWVCKKRMKFTHFHYIWDKKQYVEIMSFSGWYLFGGVAMVGSKQGVNILLNIFKGVAVNAAVGIANQVRSAIYGFVTSFQTAFNPQIVKLYATNSKVQLLQLIYRSTKFSYYLLFLLSLPVIIYCKEVLSIWLVEVPEYTVIFTKLVIIASFFEAISAPLWTAIGATGQVKRYQLWVSVIILLDIPFVYFALLLGFSPEYVFWINIVVSFLAYVYRLLYIRRYVDYSLRSYLKEVIIPCLLITITSIPVPILLYKNNASIIYLVLMVGVTVIITGISIYLLGLTKSEKTFIIKTIQNKLKIKKQ